MSGLGGTSDSDSVSVSDLVSDPVACQHLIGVRTVVKMKNKSEVSGYLTAFDPVTGSLIVEEGSGYRLILPDHVVGLDFDRGDCINIDLIGKRQKASATRPEGEINERRRRAIRIINEARLTADILKDGSIDVASVARIKPPFTSEDVESSNRIILSRIRELIQD